MKNVDIEFALAAHLGVEYAVQELGLDPYERYPEFAAWAWAFSQWGVPTMARVTTSAARLALPVWQKYEPVAPWEREIVSGFPLLGLLQRLEECLSLSDPTDLLRVESAKAESALSRLELGLEEASGSVERVQARERLWAAAYSVASAARTALWTPDDVVTNDPAERTAQLEAGPALHVVDCLSNVCLATGLSRREFAKALAEGYGFK